MTEAHSKAEIISALRRCAERSPLTRTKKKAIAALVDRMVQFAEGGKDYSGKCFISTADCQEEALQLASLIEENFPNLDGKVQISSIGTVIGSHTGPGTVALFFWGTKRED